MVVYKNERVDQGTKIHVMSRLLVPAIGSVGCGRGLYGSNLSVRATEPCHRQWVFQWAIRPLSFLFLDMSPYSVESRTKITQTHLTDLLSEKQYLEDPILSDSIPHAKRRGSFGLLHYQATRPPLSIGLSSPSIQLTQPASLALANSYTSGQTRPPTIAPCLSLLLLLLLLL